MTFAPNDSPATPSIPDRAALLGGVRLMVVKVGTNVLTRPSGEMGLGRIHNLVEDLVDVHRGGRQVILVSSGAISMGMNRLALKERPTFLPDKQACAAVGQSRLMSIYEQAFHRFGIATAQILLTEDDFANRVRYLNLRNTMSGLLEHRVVPIVNENDTVSTTEIEVAGTAEGGHRSVFGDNDRLSALVMSKLGGDLLVLLTDVDGLYRNYSSGTTAAAAKPLATVTEITAEIEAMAQRGNNRGRGGMLSKLQSIRIAVEAGGVAVIANGKRPGVLQELLAGEELGTLFLPRRRRSSRKRWLAYASAPSGTVTVNAGARKALVESSSSLLFAGVTAIAGEFRRGDVVVVRDEAGDEIARGIVNYGATDARPLLGKRSSEITAAGGKNYEEFITRDNLAVLVDGA